MPICFLTSQTPLPFSFFFFNDPPTPEISSLPLHDALPISADGDRLLLDRAARPPRLAGIAALRGDGMDGRLHVVRGRHRGDGHGVAAARAHRARRQDRKSTRLNSSHLVISYAVFCL